jgi:hypothetical protein
MTWTRTSGEGFPVFRIVAVRHFPLGTCLQTPATAVSIFWTASGPRGSVTSTLIAVQTLAKHPAVFVHDRVLAACSARAESGDARVRCRHARWERPGPRCRCMGLTRCPGGDRRPARAVHKRSLHRPPFTPVSKHRSGLTDLSLRMMSHGRLLAGDCDRPASRRSHQRMSCEVIFGGERK